MGKVTGAEVKCSRKVELLAEADERHTQRQPLSRAVHCERRELLSLVSFVIPPVYHISYWLAA